MPQCNPETPIVNRVRLAAAPYATLWRNNVGVAYRRDGVPVRFGLCPGSSDLIGLTHAGVFVAIEVKQPGGRVRPEQLAFLEHIAHTGGIAIITTGETYVREILREAHRGAEVRGRVHSEVPLPRRQTELTLHHL